MDVQISPYSIVLSNKKSGKIRICMNYHKLNDVTRKDGFLLLQIDTILDSLGVSKYFLLDSNSGR